MNVLNVASRNVLRNGRRSLLTLLASAVGTIAILLFGGYVRDNEQGLQTVTVRNHGHLQIVVKDYLDFGGSDAAHFSIHDYEPLIARLRQDPVLAPMLSLVTPVLQVEGVAGNFEAGASSTFVGEGVIPTEYATQLAWDGLGAGIRPSDAILRADRPEGGVLGLRLAQLLGLCDSLRLTDCKRVATPTKSAGEQVPDDIAALAADASQHAATKDPQPGQTSIELLASSPGGMPNVLRMNVIAAEPQAIRELDRRYVAMPLQLAQRLVFGTEQPGVSAVVIQLQHTRMIAAAERRVNELLRDSPQPLETLTFHDVSPAYDQILATYNSIFGFISALMGFITLFLIANAVNMAVGERVGEIGTLRSLGFQRSTIRRIFVVEGGMLGVSGALLGAAMAVAAAMAINASGLSWTPPGRTHAIPLRVDLFSNPAVIALTIAGMSVIACLSALWPATQAARLEITEALRRA